jgi:hypothetical protein
MTTPMSTPFSKRHGYHQTVPREPIIEAAPSFLRIPFIKNILLDLIYHNYSKINRPFRVSELCETLYVMFKKERIRRGDYGFDEEVEPIIPDIHFKRRSKWVMTRNTT